MRVRSRRLWASVVVSMAVSTFVVPGSAAAAEPTVPVGARSFQSVNYPDRYIANDGGLGANGSVSSSSGGDVKADATWTVTPGLAGGENCVSFQSPDGFWLRHKDFRLRIDKNDGSATFLADATFCVRSGAADGSVTFESYNYPNRVIRHRDFQLWLDTKSTSSLFLADSSFKVVAPWQPSTRINPRLKGLYGDPHAQYMAGKYWIFPTTDGYEGWSGSRFKAFSSTDLVNWTDHGTILDLSTDISWADNRAWAPAAIEKNGSFYFYFSADTNIGVAKASNPAGPYVDALGRPLVKAGDYSGQAIDPQVFTDDNGQSYLYWGNGTAYGVPLNSDMTSFNPGSVRSFDGLTNFREASFLFKRNGIYYMMYSVDDTRSENYRVAYATGNSPLGPWNYRGEVLSKDLSKGVKGTGHHSVVKDPNSDTWYIVYHRFAVPAGDGTNREVAIDRMYFRSDGTIQPVVVSP
jgi:hypothetical protein